MKNWILSIVVTVVAAGIGWLIITIMTLSSEVATLKLALADKQRDDRQDASIRMHWKYQSWLRNHVNKLYQMNGWSIPEEPDLD